jgi:hypothetical protein
MTDVARNRQSFSALPRFLDIGLPQSDKMEAVPVHMMMEMNKVAERLDFDAGIMRLITLERFMKHLASYVYQSGSPFYSENGTRIKMQFPVIRTTGPFIRRATETKLKHKSVEKIKI